MEGDASSASYFLAGATMTGSTIRVVGCGSDSLQGDKRFAEVWQPTDHPYCVDLNGSRCGPWPPFSSLYPLAIPSLWYFLSFAVSSSHLLFPSICVHSPTTPAAPSFTRP